MYRKQRTDTVTVGQIFEREDREGLEGGEEGYAEVTEGAEDAEKMWKDEDGRAGWLAGDAVTCM